MQFPSRTVVVVLALALVGVTLFVLRTKTSAASPAPSPPSPAPAPILNLKPISKPAPAPSKPAPAPVPTMAATTLPAAATIPVVGGNQALWDCQREGKSQGPVKITWGYKTEDATWACNEWRAGCEKKCTAVAATRGPNQEYWSCVDSSGKTLDPIKIWWGYKPADAAWACNEWMPACGKKCTAAPAN